MNKKLEELEFSSQQAWKFNESSDYHNWWMEMPGCKCPVHDNRERAGFPGNIYSSDCVWHGWFDQSKTEL